MDISLAGRSAIVTGGSKGIGLAVAARFAASGADVAIVARGREALDEALKTISATARGRVIALQGDVARVFDIQRAYDGAMRDLGKIDIVVNNAGTSRHGAFEDITDEIWQQDFDQKLRRHPSDAARLAADEGAPVGADHQRSQRRRQGAARWPTFPRRTGSPCRASRHRLRPLFFKWRRPRPSASRTTRNSTP